MAFAGRAKHVFLPFSDFDFLARTFGASGIPNPLAQSDALLTIDPTLAEMRLTKDADEIAALREAIDLTAEALNEAFRAAEPGMREVDLAAILRYAFDKRETEESFLQAASGPNSTEVHFGATARPLAAATSSSSTSAPTSAATRRTSAGRSRRTAVSPRSRGRSTHSSSKPRRPVAASSSRASPSRPSRPRSRTS